MEQATQPDDEPQESDYAEVEEEPFLPSSPPIRPATNPPSEDQSNVKFHNRGGEAVFESLPSKSLADFPLSEEFSSSAHSAATSELEAKLRLRMLKCEGRDAVVRPSQERHSPGRVPSRLKKSITIAPSTEAKEPLQWQHKDSAKVDELLVTASYQRCTQARTQSAHSVMRLIRKEVEEARVDGKARSVGSRSPASSLEDGAEANEAEAKTKSLDADLAAVERAELKAMADPFCTLDLPPSCKTFALDDPDRDASSEDEARPCGTEEQDDISMDELLLDLVNHIPSQMAQKIGRVLQSLQESKQVKDVDGFPEVVESHRENWDALPDSLMDETEACAEEVEGQEASAADLGDILLKEVATASRRLRSPPPEARPEESDEEEEEEEEEEDKQGEVDEEEEEGKAGEKEEEKDEEEKDEEEKNEEEKDEEGKDEEEKGEEEKDEEGKDEEEKDKDKEEKGEEEKDEEERDEEKEEGQEGEDKEENEQEEKEEDEEKEEEKIEEKEEENEQQGGSSSSSLHPPYQDQGADSPPTYAPVLERRELAHSAVEASPLQERGSALRSEDREAEESRCEAAARASARGGGEEQCAEAVDLEAIERSHRIAQQQTAHTEKQLQLAQEHVQRSSEKIALSSAEISEMQACSVGQREQAVARGRRAESLRHEIRESQAAQERIRVDMATATLRHEQACHRYQEPRGRDDDSLSAALQERLQNFSQEEEAVCTALRQRMAVQASRSRRTEAHLEAEIAAVAARCGEEGWRRERPDHREPEGTREEIKRKIDHVRAEVAALQTGLALERKHREALENDSDAKGACFGLKTEHVAATAKASEMRQQSEAVEEEHKRCKLKAGRLATELAESAAVRDGLLGKLLQEREQVREYHFQSKQLEAERRQLLQARELLHGHIEDVRASVWHRRDAVEDLRKIEVAARMRVEAAEAMLPDRIVAKESRANAVIQARWRLQELDLQGENLRQEVKALDEKVSQAAYTLRCTEASPSSSSSASEQGATLEGGEAEPSSGRQDAGRRRDCEHPGSRSPDRSTAKREERSSREDLERPRARSPAPPAQRERRRSREPLERLRVKAAASGEDVQPKRRGAFSSAQAAGHKLVQGEPSASKQGARASQECEAPPEPPQELHKQRPVTGTVRLIPTRGKPAEVWTEGAEPRLEEPREVMER